MRRDCTRVYLSLPISGHDEKERRQYAARTSGTLMWLHEDWEVVNPFHVGDELRKRKLDEGDWSLPTWEEYMLVDLVALRECEKAVFCPGWEASKGCWEEYKECLRRGIEIGVWDEESECVMWKSKWGEMTADGIDGQRTKEEEDDGRDEDYLGMNWCKLKD